MCKSVIVYLDSNDELQDNICLNLNNFFSECDIESYTDYNQTLISIKRLIIEGKKIPIVFVGEKILNKYGNGFFHELKKLARLSNIILLSSEQAITNISSNIKNIGLYDYITKNFLNKNIFMVVSEAIKNYTMNLQLERSYKVDSLTGLYNRETLVNNIESSNNPALLLINIDDFKFINAAHGYTNGDIVLKQIALMLKKKFGNDKVYRLISDEFVILFEETKLSELMRISEDFRTKILDTDFFINEITKVHVTVSIAISNVKENIIEDAQNAIHESTKYTKNTVSLAQEVKKKKESLFTLANLQMALDTDNIMPFYQGIRNNRTGKIDKYECLVRLKDGDNKIISPFHFLSLAQSVGMIPEITKLVIQKSFKEFSNKECSFSINITEDDLMKNYLVDFVRNEAKNNNLDLSRVVFEILENINLESTSNISHQISGLKALGCKIAFDDFGCEKSNFSRMLELNIDIIKIDSMFIKNIHNDPKSYKLAKAITNLAKDFGCMVIAEGVECLEAQKIVESLSIDYTQGYYYSKPEEFI